MRTFIKKLIASIFSLLFILIILIGGILYFGLFEQISNSITGVYYVNKGDRAYRKRDLPKAIEYYRKGLKAYPKHYEAWTNLGNIYVVFEDFYDAKDAYEHAIEQKPNYTLARMNYGVIAVEKLGDFEEAIRQFKSVIDTNNRTWHIPFIFNSKKSSKINKGLAYYNLGVAYRAKSFYEFEDKSLAQMDLMQAINAYEDAVKILPKDYNTIFNLAVVYQLTGQHKKSAINYCRAISLEPMNYEAHYNLAVLLRHLKMYKEAYDEIEKASLLVTEGNINSNSQSYVFDILNDMTMALIINSSYNYLVEKPATSYEVTYVHGKIVATDELDRAILNNLKKCAAEDYLSEE